MKEKYGFLLKQKDNDMHEQKDDNIDVQSILNAATILSETMEFDAVINKPKVVLAIPLYRNNKLMGIIFFLAHLHLKISKY